MPMILPERHWNAVESPVDLRGVPVRIGMAGASPGEEQTEVFSTRIPHTGNYEWGHPSSPRETTNEEMTMKSTIEERQGADQPCPPRAATTKGMEQE